MRQDHETAELVEVPFAQRADGGERPGVLRYDVPASLANGIGESFPVLGELAHRDVAQGAHVGEHVTQELHASLAFGPAKIVLRRRELVLHPGVADEKNCSAQCERDRLCLQRPAVDEQRVIGFAERGDELIHDPAHRSDVGVLRGLAREREIRPRERLVADERRHGQRDGHLERRR